MINLSGTWEFRLDPDDLGVAEGWASLPLPDRVQLPGSLDQNGVGTPNDDQTYLGGLSRKVKYVGAAWYSREVDLPATSDGERLILNLERTHWFTEVWIDGVRVGAEDSLSVPHRYDITGARGRARLTIRVDNTPRIPIGRIGHSLTDWTQTNWNGIIGEISVTRQSGPIQDLRLVPGAESLELRGVASRPTTMSVKVGDRAPIQVSFPQGEFAASVAAPGVTPWSEENPALYEVLVGAEGQEFCHQIGFRSVRTEGKQILLNDRPLFLRGTLENCVFPKTGYPPTDLASWEHVMARAKAYGLNHLRFHSWCPPEAAFAAADRAGIILQAELPLWTGLWSISSEPELLAFCRQEAHRILRQYGHHPSFALFTLGNEMSFYGSEPEVDRLLNELKDEYPGRLYNFSAHGTHLSKACDYYVQADNGKPGPENKPLRGSTWFGVGSRFDRESPNTLTTCDEAASEFDRPVISHEVAEWAVFPDVYNESRYDGVLEARNFRTIAAMLSERGMADQAPAFVHASGKLSAQLYKEEIETLLRTKGLAGYQLLGLTDFPGQGTATIGMLDAFWDDKGFVTGEAFREFCAPTVPLAAFEKVVWQQSESYHADISVFHSGTEPTCDLRWKVLDEGGSVVRDGQLGCHALTPGAATPFDSVEICLSGLATPTRYTFVLEAAGLGQNRWSFWVVPDALPEVDLPNVHVARFYREDVREALRAGKDVWLRINPKTTWSGIPGRFAPAFWSPIHFKEQVGTMGTLIDATHPMFSDFPTEGFTDGQWWDVLTNSKAVVLDALPKDYRPALQVIDRFERNHKLGTIFEAKVASGRLLATMVDFDETDRLATRQLEHSIRRYLASDRFRPSQELALSDLDRVYTNEP
jgi:hypothetical protein